MRAGPAVRSERVRDVIKVLSSFLFFGLEKSHFRYITVAGRYF